MHEAICPACQHLLRIPADVQEPGLTCPRCLAQIERPVIGPPARTEPPAADAGPWAVTTCPACAKPVVSEWRYCPFCETTLQRPGRRWVQQSLEEDVRRDTRTTSIGIIILAAIGAMGTGSLLLASLAAAGQGEIGPLAASVMALAFLSLVSMAIVFWRTRHDPSQRGIGRVLVGALALSGIFIIVVILVIVALFAYLFVVCFGAMGGGR